LVSLAIAMTTPAVAAPIGGLGAALVDQSLVEPVNHQCNHCLALCTERRAACLYAGTNRQLCNGRLTICRQLCRASSCGPHPPPAVTVPKKQPPPPPVGQKPGQKTAKVTQ